MPRTRRMRIKVSTWKTIAVNARFILLQSNVQFSNRTKTERFLHTSIKLKNRIDIGLGLGLPSNDVAMISRASMTCCCRTEIGRINRKVG